MGHLRNPSEAQIPAQTCSPGSPKLSTPSVEKDVPFGALQAPVTHPILLCIANTGLTAICGLCIANKGLIGILEEDRALLPQGNKS